MPSIESAFNAAPAAVGYLYQARLALALCLRYAYVNAAIEIAIERFDDVSFEQNGTPIELLQAKHHFNRSTTLTDVSADLWKTLRVWSEACLNDPGLPSRVRFVLMTTSIAPEDSAAGLLRLSNPDRTVPGQIAKLVATRLTTIAQTAQNQSLKPAFEAFLRLTTQMRAALLSAVVVLDAQPHAEDLGLIVEDQIKMMVPRGQAGKARELLEGWWWPRVIAALSQAPTGAISVIEVETKLDEIREQFQRNALTTEFEDATPPDATMAAYEGHEFVRQLKLVGIGETRIDLAKRDFYRAFSQRSEWARTNVVLDGEIARFETTLLEEWQPRFEAMCENHAGLPTDAADLRLAGRRIYEWVETEARFPFRSLVKRFLNVGSFHILANAFRIGWHRDFADHQDRRE